VATNRRHWSHLLELYSLAAALKSQVWVYTSKIGLQYAAQSHLQNVPGVHRLNERREGCAQEEAQQHVGNHLKRRRSACQNRLCFAVHKECSYDTWCVIFYSGSTDACWNGQHWHRHHALAVGASPDNQ
jgi:hypothetical protein